MNKKLKKYLKSLKDFHSYEQVNLFEINDIHTIFYVFVLRYKAIESDLNLPKLNIELQEYLNGNIDNSYPYDDLFSPFLEFIEILNSDFFNSIDTHAHFGFRDLRDITPDSFHYHIKLAQKEEIHDWSLSAFNKTEFDLFFRTLIEEITTRRHEVVRSYPESFAEFISDIIPDKKDVLYLGDDKMELSIKRVERDAISHISGSSKVTFWHFLRHLLNGNQEIKFIENELKDVISNNHGVIVGILPFGKVDKHLFLKKKGISSHLECIYLNICHAVLKKSKGLGVLILPEEFLFKKSKDHYELRKSFVDNGLINKIIRLPKGLFTPLSAAKFVIMVLDHSEESNSVQFIDGIDIAEKLSPYNDDELKVFFKKLKSHYYSELLFNTARKIVKTKEIQENNYNLALSNYVNILDKTEDYFRFGEEELLSFFDLFEGYKLPFDKNPDLKRIIGPGELSDSIDEFRIEIEDSAKKIRKPDRTLKLESNALLISNWNDSLRVGYFEFKGEPVYLTTNVRAFDLKSSQSIEYLVMELLSDFVAAQLRRIEIRGSLPTSPDSLLKNLYLRVPLVEQQEQFYYQTLQKIANNRLKEIEGLHESIRYVEREVFSSFAHDFGKHLLKVSSNINAISEYLNTLHHKGKLSLDEPIIDTNINANKVTLRNLLNQITDNHSQSRAFLKNSIVLFNSENVELQSGNIGKALLEWKNSVTPTNYKILFLEEPLNQLSESLWKQYPARFNKELLFHALNNLLDNAIEHGFKDPTKSYEFVISIWADYTFDAGGTQVVSGRDLKNLRENHYQLYLEIGNNGAALPDDLSCEDIFKRGHKGAASLGSGIGGYNIMRAFQKMNAKISCDGQSLDKSKYPVCFKIEFDTIKNFIKSE